MKKVIFLCIAIILLISGCSKVSYSEEFPGIPVYPGTELISNNEFDDRVSVTYVDMSFKGDIEKVRSFFEKNLDKDIWTMEASNQHLAGHNVDKLYGYVLKSKDRNAGLTIAYTNSAKVGKHISIVITGGKLK